MVPSEENCHPHPVPDCQEYQHDPKEYRTIEVKGDFEMRGHQWVLVPLCVCPSFPPTEHRDNPTLGEDQDIHNMPVPPCHPHPLPVTNCSGVGGGQNYVAVISPHHTQHDIVWYPECECPISGQHRDTGETDCHPHDAPTCSSVGGGEWYTVVDGNEHSRVHVQECRCPTGGHRDLNETTGCHFHPVPDKCDTEYEVIDGNGHVERSTPSCACPGASHRDSNKLSDACHYHTVPDECGAWYMLANGNYAHTRQAQVESIPPCDPPSVDPPPVDPPPVDPPRVDPCPDGEHRDNDVGECHSHDVPGCVSVGGGEDRLTISGSTHTLTHVGECRCPTGGHRDIGGQECHTHAVATECGQTYLEIDGNGHVERSTPSCVPPVTSCPADEHRDGGEGECHAHPVPTGCGQSYLEIDGNGHVERSTPSCVPECPPGGTLVRINGVLGCVKDCPAGYSHNSLWQCVKQCEYWGPVVWPDDCAPPPDGVGNSVVLCHSVTHDSFTVAWNDIWYPVKRDDDSEVRVLQLNIDHEDGTFFFSRTFAYEDLPETDPESVWLNPQSWLEFPILGEHYKPEPSTRYKLELNYRWSVGNRSYMIYEWAEGWCPTAAAPPPPPPPPPPSLTVECTAVTDSELKVSWQGVPRHVYYPDPGGYGNPPQSAVYPLHLRARDASSGWPDGGGWFHLDGADWHLPMYSVWLPSLPSVDGGFGPVSAGADYEIELRVDINGSWPQEARDAVAALLPSGVTFPHVAAASCSTPLLADSDFGLRCVTIPDEHADTHSIGVAWSPVAIIEQHNTIRKSWRHDEGVFDRDGRYELRLRWRDLNDGLDFNINDDWGYSDWFDPYDEDQNTFNSHLEHWFTWDDGIRAIDPGEEWEIQVRGLHPDPAHPWRTITVYPHPNRSVRCKAPWTMPVECITVTDRHIHFGWSHAPDWVASPDNETRIRVRPRVLYHDDDHWRSTTLRTDPYGNIATEYSLPDTAAFNEDELPLLHGWPYDIEITDYETRTLVGVSTERVWSGGVTCQLLLTPIPPDIWCGTAEAYDDGNGYLTVEWNDFAPSASEGYRVRFRRVTPANNRDANNPDGWVSGSINPDDDHWMDESYSWAMEPWDYPGDFSWPVELLAGYGLATEMVLPTAIQGSISAGTEWEVQVRSGLRNHTFDSAGAAVTCAIPATPSDPNPDPDPNDPDPDPDPNDPDPGVIIRT